MAQTSAAYRISFKKILRAAAAEVRVHKKLAIISYVLYGVSFLLAVFHSEIRYINLMMNEPGELRYYPSSWGLAFAVAGIVVGYFTALNVFRDMNNQQLCDVSMALPIKASERFFSKLICLFYIQIAPLVTATFIGNGIKLLYGYAVYGGKTPDGSAEKMFTIVFGCLAASLFIMAIAVLCACCCGAFAESAYFSLILMFIINAMPITYINNVVCESAGIGINPYETNNIVDLGYWGLIYVIGYVENVIPHCIVNCVISLALMLLSGLIYVKRDARSVGTPIASRLFFEIIMFTGCMTVFSFFAMSDGVMWGVLVAGVLYIIVNIIVSRAKINVFSFLKWAGKYVATTAVFTAILIATITTGGFGLINARPDIKYLSDAEFFISYDDYVSFSISNENYSTERSTRFESAPLTAEQADEVISICKKHIIKGRSEISTAAIIFGKIYEPQMAHFRMTAESDTNIYEVTGLKSFVTEIYNNGKLCHRLYYRQNITISLSEAKAMIKELTDLGYIRPENDIYATAL